MNKEFITTIAATVLLNCSDDNNLSLNDSLKKQIEFEQLNTNEIEYLYQEVDRMLMDQVADMFVDQ